MSAPFPDIITNGEKYGPAMEITDEVTARAYFERCVEHAMRRFPDKTREEVEAIERSNLGYYAGYYSEATRARVERLFAAVHPIFGSMQEKQPRPEEAFEMGKRWAEGRRQ